MTMDKVVNMLNHFKTSTLFMSITVGVQLDMSVNNSKHHMSPCIEGI
jgi:hypothetical protein